MSKSKSSNRRHSSAQSNDIKLDVIDVILEDHKPLKELIKIMKNPDRAMAERKTAFNKFAPLLIAHAKPEEKSLYFFMKREDELREPALEGDIEHAIADQLVKEAKQTEDDDLFSAGIKVLAELVEHHIQEEEEEEIFPQVRKEISAELRAVLADEYLIYQQEVESEADRETIAARTVTVHGQEAHTGQAH